MEWITKAANEQNAASARRVQILGGTAPLWADLTRAISESVHFYSQLPIARPHQLSGVGTDTIAVRVFSVPGDSGSELGSVTVTLVRGSHGVEVNHAGVDVPSTQYTIGLDADKVRVLSNDLPISAEKFAEQVLRPVLFPK
jgi:hypothetical protein